MKATAQASTKNLILFDFDGVIADSFKTVSRIIIAISKKHHFPIYTEDDVRTLYTKNFYKELEERGISGNDIETIMNEKMWEPVMGTIPLVKGMEKLIPELALKHTLAIITSADNEWTTSVLDRYSLQEYFIGVFGKESGFSKVDKMRRIIKMQKKHSNNIYYIGDTTGDIEEGRVAGVKTIGVCWGYHTKEQLRDAHPDYLVDSIRKLRTILL